MVKKKSLLGISWLFNESLYEFTNAICNLNISSFVCLHRIENLCLGEPLEVEQDGCDQRKKQEYAEYIII